ncbi:retrovirus-related pol polyprotein from transposon TNT 1-94 [Tanacetum coccineum]
MTLDIHNWLFTTHQEISKIVKDESFPIVNQVDARLQNFKNTILKEAAKFVRDFKSLAKEADESLAKHKALEFEIERLLRAVLDRMKEKLENCIIKKEKEYDVLWNNWYTKCEECKYDKISYDKAYNDMQQKFERLQAQLGDLKGKSKDTPCVSDTLDPVSQKLEDENMSLEFQVLNYAKENAHLKTTYKNLFDSINVTRDKVSEQKDITKGTSVNTKFSNQSSERKPSLQSFRNNSVVRQPNAFQSERLKFSKTWVPPKVVETHDLSNPATLNSVPTTTEPKVIINDKVITPGMFRINSFKTSREDKFLPINKVRASVRTNPITVSQPHVITKKHINSDSNGLSSIGVDNTAKTRRPQPRSNTKNDRVPSASKSSCIKNKENDKSEVVLLCDINSRVNKFNANVSNTAYQKKHKPKDSKPKKVGSKQRLDSPKPMKPRTCLRWSPTGRIFYLKGKIIESSESESQYDYSKDSGCLKHITGNLKLLINFVLKFLGTVRFGNDHVATILGYGDLQWGNILITKIYFVEGLRHNLFSVGQFCDLDLEVTFRRNTCFVRNLDGVDLLKGNRTTNLYTINLHEMTSASPICLMARATSTKSWLWHQRLSHLNFDTINDLAKKDLVTGLPKFKYHKEHLCPSCEHGKRKKAFQPPKLVPNSKHKLHLLHMDLCVLGIRKYQSLPLISLDSS